MRREALSEHVSSVTCNWTRGHHVWDLRHNSGLLIRSDGFLQRSRWKSCQFCASLKKKKKKKMAGRNRQQGIRNGKKSKGKVTGN